MLENVKMNHLFTCRAVCLHRRSTIRLYFDLSENDFWHTRSGALSNTTKNIYERLSPMNAWSSYHSLSAGVRWTRQKFSPKLKNYEAEGVRLWAAKDVS